MYYTSKNKFNYGILVTFFLGIVIVILINLINKIDIFLENNKETLEIQEVGNLNVENNELSNITKNISYSVVRYF